MNRVGLVVLAFLICSPALAADWRGGPTTSDGVTPNYTLDPKGTRVAFWVFVNGDSTTTSGPVLRTVGCDRIEVTTFWSGATAGVKLFESTGAPGTSVASTNLPQITTDFDADGVADSSALDQLTIAKSGLRDFMAYGISPNISAACSTGTCALKVQCGGSSK